MSHWELIPLITLLYPNGKYNFSKKCGKLFNSLLYLLLGLNIIIFIEFGKFVKGKLKL